MDVPIWSAPRWPPLPPAQAILLMYVIFKENSMKPMIAVLIAAALTLVGCNTVQGIGQDLEKAGSAIERAGSN